MAHCTHARCFVVLLELAPAALCRRPAAHHNNCSPNTAACLLLCPYLLTPYPPPCSTNCSESVAALKRLLREVFAEQLKNKTRLDSLEAASRVQLEAADDFELARASSSSSSSGSASSWSRAAARLSGTLGGAGALIWTQVPQH